MRFDSVNFSVGHFQRSFSKFLEGNIGRLRIAFLTWQNCFDYVLRFGWLPSEISWLYYCPLLLCESSLSVVSVVLFLFNFVFNLSIFFLITRLCPRRETWLVIFQVQRVLTTASTSNLIQCKLFAVICTGIDQFSLPPQFYLYFQTSLPFFPVSTSLLFGL